MPAAIASSTLYHRLLGGGVGLVARLCIATHVCTPPELALVLQHDSGARLHALAAAHHGHPARSA